MNGHVLEANSQLISKEGILFKEKGDNKIKLFQE